MDPTRRDDPTADLARRRAEFRSSTRSWLLWMALATAGALVYGIVTGNAPAAGAGVLAGLLACAFLGWALWKVRDRG